MYPSNEYPHYGVFVENTEKILNEMENISVDKVVITKTDNKVKKLFEYLLFYLKIIFKGLFGKYDVLYGHFISHIAIPVLIIKLFNKKLKVVVNVHGNDVVPDQEKDNKWIPLVRKALLKTDYLVVPSSYFKNIMICDYGFPEEKTFIFPSGGVNTSVFCEKNKSSVLDKFKLESDRKYIGYVSRIEKDKGWDIFLDMAHELKSCNSKIKFIVVGDGDEMEMYNSKVKTLGLEDDIIKYKLLSQNEISDIFNLLDIFVFPTYRKSESLGLVGLEAMACGTVIVSSDLYGPSTYTIDGYNGFTFKAKDGILLKDKILSVLAMSETELNEIKKNAKKTAYDYSELVVSEKIRDIFEEINIG